MDYQTDVALLCFNELLDKKKLSNAQIENRERTLERENVHEAWGNGTICIHFPELFYVENETMTSSDRNLL